jgi:1-deoxy-D-xylulose-5-phosphate synthase
MVARYRTVVVLEDGIRHGGIASSISEVLRDAGMNVALHSIGVPLEFLEHSKRSEILSDIGITAQNIARSVVEWSSDFKEEMQPQQDENANRRQNR